MNDVLPCRVTKRKQQRYGNLLISIFSKEQTLFQYTALALQKSVLEDPSTSISSV